MTCPSSTSPPTSSRSPGRWSTRRRCRAPRRRSPTPSRRRCAASAGSRWSGSATACSPAPTSACPTRVVLAGHLDTVPIADNVPSELREVDGVQRLYGCGTSDMKSGDAVMLRLAGRFGVPGRRARARPHVRLLRQRGGRARARTGSAGWPASGAAGSTATSPSCSSRRTARSRPAARARCAPVLDVPGRRAHSARSWLGRQRHPRRCAGAVDRAGRLRAARGGDRRLPLPRGPQRGRHQRWRRRQRDPRRGRR